MYIANKPSFIEEKTLIKCGYNFVAGVDETGRGALAGPVTAAAVIINCRGKDKAPWYEEIRDSKLLNPSRREYLYRHIEEASLSVGIGMVTPDEIDSCGIVNAVRKAMKQAIELLTPAPDYLLIDYLNVPDVKLPQKGITYGDRLCFSIACASIIAKVSRDRFMCQLEEIYPGYNLAKHKGYGTKDHLSCLLRIGACPVHRRSFMPVRGMD